MRKCTTRTFWSSIEYRPHVRKHCHSWTLVSRLIWEFIFPVLLLLCVLWREHKVSYLWAVLGVWRKSLLVKRSPNTLHSDFISWFISLRPNLTHLKTPLLWKRLLFCAVTKEALSFVKVRLRFVSTSEYIFYHVVGNWVSCFLPTSWNLGSQPSHNWDVTRATFYNDALRHRLMRWKP